MGCGTGHVCIPWYACYIQQGAALLAAPDTTYCFSHLRHAPTPAGAASCMLPHRCPDECRVHCMAAHRCSRKAAICVGGKHFVTSGHPCMGIYSFMAGAGSKRVTRVTSVMQACLCSHNTTRTGAASKQPAAAALCQVINSSSCTPAARSGGLQPHSSCTLATHTGGQAHGKHACMGHRPSAGRASACAGQTTHMDKGDKVAIIHMCK